MKINTELQAINLARRLCERGCEAKIAHLPKEWAIDGKVDIDGALAAGHTPDEFQSILYQALSPVDFFNTLGLQAREAIWEALNQAPEFHPDRRAAEAIADQIAMDPQLLKRRIDVVNTSGVVGERRNIAMYFAALDSRLLPESLSDPNTLAVKMSGHSGGGKSFSLKKCLEIYPDDAVRVATGGSSKSLYHVGEDALKHRCLILSEAYHVQENRSDDNEMALVIRSILSEGRVNYMVAERGDNNKLHTKDVILNGPISFITTTTVDHLEAQLEDRLFTVHPDESQEQTAAILKAKAKLHAGKIQGLSNVLSLAWIIFHDSLEPVDILIPYAEKIVDALPQVSKLPISTRRAFRRVLSVLQAIACAYQHQRTFDDSGRLVAEIADYAMAQQIVREAFKESLGQGNEKTDARLNLIETLGPIKAGDVAKFEGVSKQAISSWVRPRVEEGILLWCDQAGAAFPDSNSERKAKKTGKGFLRVADDYLRPDVTGLPSPFDITQDPEWKEGGALYETYDLCLGRWAGEPKPPESAAIKLPSITAEPDADDLEFDQIPDEPASGDTGNAGDKEKNLPAPQVQNKDPESYWDDNGNFVPVESPEEVARLREAEMQRMCDELDAEEL